MWSTEWPFRAAWGEDESKDSRGGGGHCSWGRLGKWEHVTAGQGKKAEEPCGQGSPSLKTPDTAWEQGADPGEPGTLLRWGRLRMCAPTGGEHWRAEMARASKSRTCPSRPRDVIPVTSSRWLDFGLGGAFTPRAAADAANQGLLFWFGPRFPQHPLPTDRKGSQGDRRERMAGNDALAGVCEPAPEAFVR